MDGKKIRCSQIASPNLPLNYNRFSDIATYWSKSSFFHTPLHSTPLIRGFPSERRHLVWQAKTRMAWLPNGEKISKISLFDLAQITNVTDGQTDTGWRHIPRLCIASRGKNSLWRTAYEYFYFFCYARYRDNSTESKRQLSRSFS